MAGRLVPDHFLFFKTALYEVKVSGMQLVSVYFDSPKLSKQYEQTIKTNCIKLQTIDSDAQCF